ncbi:hypothetical protein [Flavobacterium psychrophilum]|nr:hypothetical protein [Flavobacterium psychrophilum]
MSHAVVLYYHRKGLMIQILYFKIMNEMRKNISPELEIFMTHQKIPSKVALLLIDNETLLGTEGFGWRLMKEVLRLRQVQ